MCGVGVGLLGRLGAWGVVISHCGGLETSATGGRQWERVPPGSRRVVWNGLNVRSRSRAFGSFGRVGCGDIALRRPGDHRYGWKH